MLEELVSWELLLSQIAASTCQTWANDVCCTMFAFGCHLNVCNGRYANATVLHLVTANLVFPREEPWLRHVNSPLACRRDSKRTCTMRVNRRQMGMWLDDDTRHPGCITSACCKAGTDIRCTFKIAYKGPFCSHWALQKQASNSDHAKKSHQAAHGWERLHVFKQRCRCVAE